MQTGQPGLTLVPSLPQPPHPLERGPSCPIQFLQGLGCYSHDNAFKGSKLQIPWETPLQQNHLLLQHPNPGSRFLVVPFPHLIPTGLFALELFCAAGEDLYMEDSLVRIDFSVGSCSLPSCHPRCLTNRLN